MREAHPKACIQCDNELSRDGWFVQGRTVRIADGRVRQEESTDIVVFGNRRMTTTLGCLCSWRCLASWADGHAKQFERWAEEEALRNA